MRWSLEELVRDWINVSYAGYKLWYRVVKFPVSMYRFFRSLLYWIFTGHGYSTYWSLDRNLDIIIYHKLLNFKKEITKNGMGYPFELQSTEEWISVIDTMIEGFAANMGKFEMEDDGYKFDKVYALLTNKYGIDAMFHPEKYLPDSDAKEYLAHIERSAKHDADMRAKYNKAWDLFTHFKEDLWD